MKLPSTPDAPMTDAPMTDAPSCSTSYPACPQFSRRADSSQIQPLSKLSISQPPISQPSILKPPISQPSISKPAYKLICSLQRNISSAYSPNIEIKADSSKALSKALFEAKLFPAAKLMLIALNVGGLSLIAPRAIAQSAPVIPGETVRQPSGAVGVDNNAFDLQTGDLQNGSNIPLPSSLPTQTSEGQAIPVTREQLAPNNIEIRPDVEYIERSFNEIVNPPSGQDPDQATYNLQTNSVRITSQFDLRYRRGNHTYGEGIQVTVVGSDGTIKNQQTTFVRGDQVTIGPNGQTLPSSSSLSATYSATDSVELRVLNLRNNRATPTDSGIYFAQNGDFVVEDLQNGGDLDFDDGEYVRLPGGRGEAVAIEERDNITVTTRIDEIPLDPTTRQDELVETDVVTNTERFEEIEETSRTWGTVEIPESTTSTIILGHATGARTADGEQLVYDRYAAAGEVRAGSDGIGATGQLPPLSSNPSRSPTLVTGNITFNPFVDDNEAGLTTTLSVTQFLNPTHRLATDVFGNVISNPILDARPLVEPIGLFNNRRLVGYVPATPEQTVRGEQISSANGIFTLPPDQSVEIEASAPPQVGRGNAAYTDNVGGLLIESADGELNFVPQWTKNGYAQAPLTLEAGEATRVIYALVPQQAGQSLQLGQTYDVTEGVSGHEITDGGFAIISADRQYENFVQEMSEIYAVEDTLEDTNAATTLFNGIRGIYSQVFGGEQVPTVDVTIAPEADARVGNLLFSLETIAGEDGQSAYAETTIAAGFYLGGSLTGGVGNQQDTVIQTRSTGERATDELRTRRTINTFETPRVQLNSVVIETTETTQDTGAATFDINSNGELNNVEFTSGGNPVVIGTSSRELEPTSTIEIGEEELIDSVTEETAETLSSRLISLEQETLTSTDSYANFSAVRGELTAGGVLNFGNTPWTAAANTVRAELFTRDAVFGRSAGNETGWRAEVIFHPFGEVQREAYQYDAAGNAVALYKTEPFVDDSGKQVMETLNGDNGNVAVLPVHQFAVDEAGDRIIQTVGTGRSRGPGAYLRLEDVLNDSDSAVVAGGIQFAF